MLVFYIPTGYWIDMTIVAQTERSGSATARA